MSLVLYDSKGNQIEIGTDISSSDIKTALIGAIADGSVNVGSAIGATLTVNVDATWETNAETAYQSLLTAYKASPNTGIPFFISTDQHGTGLAPNRWVNNRDSDGMNIVNLNLGDTVTDYFNLTQLNDILTQTRQIKNYIGVIGNHECVYKYESMNEYDLCRTFITTNLERRMNPDNENCYSVIDTLHNVKYIILEEYAIHDDGAGFDRGLTGKTTDWLISELKDDNYDIVILKHWPFKFGSRGQWTQRDGTVLSNESAYLEELTDMMIARKNKTSGTFTDIESTSHDYDFSTCKTNLLCALHGHNHGEYYGTANNFLCYATDTMLNDTSCTFGLIDRDTGKLRVWVFGGSTLGVLEELAMDLNI